MLVVKRDLYRYIGRKQYGVRKVEKDEADADDTTEKVDGKGIDVSTNTVENVDAVDSNIDQCTNPESDEESSIETISNFTEDGLLNNTEKQDDDEDVLKEKSDEETYPAGVKRKYSPSVIDFLINNNTDNSSIPPTTKKQCLASSTSDCNEKNDALAKYDVDDFDTQLSKLLDEKKDHSLIKIPPTKRKKYPQKICVRCRRDYGVRNHTRHICTICDVALCKGPCFVEYHCNK